MTDLAETIDNSHTMTSVMVPVHLKLQESKAENRYNGLIMELARLGRLGGVKQVAFITRDGMLINCIPENTCTGIFAAMMAASLGAAETAFAEIQKGKPDMMVLCMNGEKIVVTGAGSEMLLMAIIEDKARDVLPIIEKTAEIIKSML